MREAEVYRPDEVVAIADWLNGGHGLLLTLMEHQDEAWADDWTKLHPSRCRGSVRGAGLPGCQRRWRSSTVALSLPQRIPRVSTTVLAEEIADHLDTTVDALKQQELVTPDDEKTLEQEIERIRRAAEERVDASTWEASDALREKVAATLPKNRMP